MLPKRRKTVKDKEQQPSSIGLNVTELTSQLETLSEPLTHHDMLLLHQLLKVNYAALLVMKDLGTANAMQIFHAYIHNRHPTKP